MYIYMKHVDIFHPVLNPFIIYYSIPIPFNCFSIQQIAG